MKFFLLLSLALALSGATEAAEAPPAAGGPPTLSAPVLLESENLGEVWAYLAKGREPELEAISLLKALSSALTVPAFEDLRASIVGRPRVKPSDLERKGISLRFDEASLVFQLQLRDSLRARKNLRVRRGHGEERVSIGPEPFSGYLNATASQGFLYPRSSSRQPFRGNLFLATNVQGVVLESGATYLESVNREWTREDTRLTKDFEDKLLRMSVGDISILGAGYQSSRPMGGISLTRQFSIQPYLNTRPLNRTELLLRRPSTIEVYVNGGFVNRVQAAPGPVQLSDFPLFSGINKVDLKITDDTGRVEWVNLNLLYDAQLLGSGIQQFAYHVGAPSEAFGNDRRYLDENLTYSLYHRAGITDRLTLGGSLQGDRALWLAGQDFVFLTRGGLFSGDAGLSHLSGGATSGAARLRYRSLDYKLGSDKPLRGTAEIEYRGRFFAALGQAGTVNDFSWRYGLSLSRPITAVTSVTAGLQYLLNRVGGPARKIGRLDFISEFYPQWRANLSYTAEKDSRLEHRVQLALTWMEEEGKYYGNFTYDYPSKTVRAEVTRNPSSLVDDFRATAGVQNAPASAQADLLLDYTHEKFNLRAEHASAYLRETAGYRRTSHNTTLSASTAVAWAGSTVAWTRPIADSFALLTAKPLFKGFPIPVNQIAGSAEATVNRIGPAVVPTLTSYNEIPLVLNSSHVPMGFSLGREYFLVRPTYRSGVRLEVGGESAAVFSGNLLEPGGKPLSLATGEVRKPNGLAVATFFTNREGGFLLENLPPGAYTLVIDDQDFLPMPLEVREDQVGFIRLPPYELKKGESE